MDREQGIGLTGPTDGVLNTAGLDVVRYDKVTGLAPVVVQDAKTLQVLMVAYANREALKRTFGTGQAWFWSRQRQDYWRKGETSGNVMEVREVRIDCDGDTVLYLVHATGPACHTGETSCFFRAMTYDEGKILSGKSLRQLAGDDTGITPEEIAQENRGPTGLFQAEEGPQELAEETQQAVADDGVAAAAAHRDGQQAFADTLNSLWETVGHRHRQRPSGFYTSYLFEQGTDKIAKKVGEEAVEVAIAAKNADAHSDIGKDEVARESADLIYHLLVLWQQTGVVPGDVAKVLADRVR